MKDSYLKQKRRHNKRISLTEATVSASYVLRGWDNMNVERIKRQALDHFSETRNIKTTYTLIQILSKYNKHTIHETLTRVLRNICANRRQKAHFSKLSDQERKDWLKGE